MSAFEHARTHTSKAQSFARLRNRDHAFVAVDRHRRVQCGRAAAEVLQKLPCVRTLHESRLEQLRIIRTSMPSWLSLADDRQHLDLLYRLRPEGKPSQVAVIQVGTVMPSKHVARG